MKLSGIAFFALAASAAVAQSSGSRNSGDPYDRLSRRDDGSDRRGSNRARYDLPRGAILPIQMNDTIDASRARVGDRFSANVTEGRSIPRGSRLEGRVERTDRRGDAFSVRLRFTDLRLPDGTRVRLDAAPVRGRADFSEGDRREDGWFDGRKNDRAKETKVIGGAVVGGILGSILKKPVEGAILGTIVGGVAAEADRDAGKPIAVRRGEKLRARLLAPLSFGNRDGVRASQPWRGTDPNDDPSLSDPDSDGRAGNARIFRGDEELRYERGDAPIVRDGVTFVPLEATARLLGVEVRRSDTGSYDLRSDRGTVRLREGETAIRRGRDESDLAAAPTAIGGALYVPLEAFSSLVQESLRTTRNRS